MCTHYGIWLFTLIGVAGLLFEDRSITADEVQVAVTVNVDQGQQKDGFITGQIKLEFTNVASPFDAVVRVQLVSGHGSTEQGVPAGALSKVLKVDGNGVHQFNLPGDFKLKPVFSGDWSIFVDVRSIGQTVLEGSTTSVHRFTLGPATTVDVTKTPPPQSTTAEPMQMPAAVKTLPLTTVANINPELANLFGDLANATKKPISVKVGGRCGCWIARERSVGCPRRSLSSNPSI